ncbi:MAG TPA: hypothetical protein VF529_21455 [Solirubrobacteraceae bacterium]|jgi:hypothetical protein
MTPRRNLSALLLVVPALALATCGGDSDEDKIKDLINDVSANAEVICDNATDRFLKEQLGGDRDECKKQAKQAEQSDRDGDVDDLKVEIDGDNATATFTDNEGDDRTVELVKQDGDWKVDSTE